MRTEVFEDALSRIEKKMGLDSQPRAVVFHEKEGRRHAHAVWSRIDTESMTAVQLSHFKMKLRDISREIYLENGWKLPRGLMNSKERDPRNFTLEEWQQAKRAGHNARDLKEAIQECWASSDSRAAFERALETRGLYLARGDRRGHVALTYEGEAFSIARVTGRKSKDIEARLGDPAKLRSVEQTKAHIASQVSPRIQKLVNEVGLLGISRGSVYYLPRPTPDADLALMRRIDELHLDYPFAGSRMLQALLKRDGFEVPPPLAATSR